MKFLEENCGGDGLAAAGEVKHLHWDLSKQENRERRCGKRFHSPGTQKGESWGSVLVTVRVSSIPPTKHKPTCIAAPALAHVPATLNSPKSSQGQGHRGHSALCQLKPSVLGSLTLFPALR